MVARECILPGTDGALHIHFSLPLARWRATRDRARAPRVTRVTSVTSISVYRSYAALSFIHTHRYQAMRLIMETSVTLDTDVTHIRSKLMCALSRSPASA